MEHTNKSAAFNLGLTIFIFLAVLTGLEFFVAIVLDAVPILAMIALVKGGLVLYYYMHISKLAAVDDADHKSYAYKTGTNRLGLWLFILSDSFVFSGLLVSRFNLLGLTRPHLNQFLGLGVTCVLLVSSFFLTNTLITIILGAAFVAGVIGVEWRLAAAEGVTASSNAGGAIFYMMTGMHAFHVLSGVIFLLIVFNNARRGVYSAEKHWGVEAATVYWHFVDVVWIFFYPALYLIGALVS
jgi:cytochrome c oxidase subunit 3